MSDEQIEVICNGMFYQPWGIGSRRRDAVAFGRAVSAAVEADYEEVLADHRRLVRELDVLLNGASAAQQASLCDIVAQVRREGVSRRGTKDKP